MLLYPSGHRLSAPIFGMDETARRPARASAARGLRLAVAAFGTVVVVAVCSATWGKRAAAADHMMWLAWRGGPASQRAGVRGRRTPGAVSLKLLEPREPRTVCHFLVGFKFHIARAHFPPKAARRAAAKRRSEGRCACPAETREGGYGVESVLGR